MKVLLVALLFAMAVAAQPVAKASANASAASTQFPSTHSADEIVSGAEVADPVFRIRTKALGLERDVEMLQWRKAELPAPAHFEMAWVTEHIDSSSFDAAHRNGNDFPFNGARFWTTDAKLDGHPVSPDVLGEVDAWTSFKPDLAQLPTNLAVSFQPDGDWLSTSQDPTHPRIGDLRVRWRAIASAPAPANATLVAGSWLLQATTVAVVAASPRSMSPPKLASPTQKTDSLPDWMQRITRDRNNLLIAGALVVGLLVLGALLWRRGSSRKPEPRSRKSRKR